MARNVEIDKTPNPNTTITSIPSQYTIGKSDQGDLKHDKSGGDISAEKDSSVITIHGKEYLLFEGRLLDDKEASTIFNTLSQTLL
jgi:hypothetical protein